MKLSIPKKNFSEVLDSYQFFERQSNESTKILSKYQSFIRDFLQRNTLDEIMDFGCGDGRFFESIILQNQRHQFENARLTLVEPDIEYRIQATNRLGHYFKRFIRWKAHDLNEVEADRYDLIISNHVLYYVSDLELTLAKLISYLKPGGALLITLSKKYHPLNRLISNLALHHKENFPYFTADCIRDQLSYLNQAYDVIEVESTLQFSKNKENQGKIVDFILGRYGNLRHDPIIDSFFGEYTINQSIQIPLLDQIIVVHKPSDAPRSNTKNECVGLKMLNSK